MASTGASLSINQPSKGAAKAPAKGPNYNSALYNPSQTLSGKQLAGAATQLANTQINPVVQSLSQQIASNNKTSKTEQGTDLNYYLQLADAARQAVAQEQQIGSGLQTTLQGIGAGTQAQLGQLGQAATGGALARMQALGLDAGQTSALQADLARQQGVGALNSQTGHTFGATQSANNAGLGANTSAAVPLAGTEQIGGLARANALANVPINQKIADEQAQRGNLTATALGQLRTQERNYQVAQEGLGIKTQSLQQTAAQDQAKNQLTARGQDITAADAKATDLLRAAGLTNTNNNNLANQQLKQQQINNTAKYDQGTLALRQQALAAKNSGKGAAKPLPLAQNNAVNASLGRIVSLIREAQQTKLGSDGKPNASGKPLTEQAIRSHLSSGANPSKKSYSPVLIEAAYELLGYGSIDQSTAEQLHRMGVRDSTYNGQSIKVTANYKPPPSYKGGEYNSAPPPAASSVTIPGL